MMIFTVTNRALADDNQNRGSEDEKEKEDGEVECSRLKARPENRS